MNKDLLFEIDKAVDSFEVDNKEFNTLMDSAIKSALGYRHKWYDRTVEKASFYKAMTTGEGQEEYITSYKDKELDSQKENRIKITRTKTKSVTQKVAAQFERIFNQPRILDSFDYSAGTDESENRANEQRERRLNSLISNFAGTKSIDMYLRDYFIYLSLIDPNAYLLITNDVEGKEVTINPDIIYSKNIWDYYYKNDVLQYLTIGYKYKEYSEVLAYGMQYQISIWCYDKDMVFVNMPDNAVTIGIDGKQLIISYTLVSETPMQVPAIRWGTDKDKYTKLETCVSIIDPVSEEYKDLINRKSEYDLSMQLHLFLQKIQKGEPCKYVDPHTSEVCRDGYMSISGHQCPNCKGSGLQTVSTSQDAIIIRTSDEDTGQPLSVNDFVSYVDLPFEIVDHQHKVLHELPTNISECIFGVDVTKIGEAMNPQTATEVNSKVDTMNGVLARYADKAATIKRFSIQQTAINFSIDNNLAISVEAPKDFKILSVSTLAQQLKLLKEAGAPADIIDNVEKQIRERQNQDNEFKNAVAAVKERFEPFKSISEPLKSSYILSLPDGNPSKILYLNQDAIYSDLEIDLPELFTTMQVKRQREEIKKKVEEIKSQMMPNNSLATFTDDEPIEEPDNTDIDA